MFRDKIRTSEDNTVVTLEGTTGGGRLHCLSVFSSFSLPLPNYTLKITAIPATNDSADQAIGCPVLLSFYLSLHQKLMQE
jgi:hypothetical protein